MFVAVHVDASVMCCEKEGMSLAPRHQHPLCLPVDVNVTDPSYSRHRITCLQYVRSAPGPPTDCKFAPIDQLNQATHYLDLSQLYGSTADEAGRVREGRGGTLKGGTQLMRSDHPSRDCQLPSVSAPGSPPPPCYVSADARVNAQPHLAALHLLWHRNHNRLARELALLQPTWDDELLYQEARRLNIAHYQRITYREWLAELIGAGRAAELTGGAAGYDPKLDAKVSNSFATAALTFSHSLLDDHLRLIDDRHQEEQVVQLRDHFNKPLDLVKQLDALVRGAVTQPAMPLDTRFANDLTNQLYSDGRMGLDQLSLDIQRGRDHGLPAWPAYRQWCGLTRPSQLELPPPYTQLDHVDLVVGALSEPPLAPPALLGATLTCLVSEQMTRTARGDRLFYEWAAGDQQQLLRHGTLAQLICDNTDNVTSMQPAPLLVPSPTNMPVSCPHHTGSPLAVS